MNDGDSAIGVCGNDRGCIFTAGNEASGVYGQPVWISIESKTKSAGRHQGIIRKKKSGILRRELEEAQNILQMTGRGNRFSIICAVALALFCAGGAIAILLGNFFLAPVMAVGFLFLPFWYVKLTANHYKRDVSAELETALSVITTAYLRTEDIVTAVEENIAYLNPPVSRVFQDFLIQIKW